MNQKTGLFTCFSLGILCSSALLAGPLSPDLKQKFSVSQPSRVPGALLPPGTYSIGVLDYLSDRSIVQVKDSGGQTKSTFIGIRRSSAPQGTQPGMNLWPNSPASTSTFRVWVLPSGQGALEFAYPKADAVALAKVNNVQVPAIDPESEGKPPAESLSPDDMQVVSLWLLSTSAVNPQTGEAAIQASHFQADSRVLAKARPVARELPHSASDLPLAGLTGLLALGLAGLLSFGRYALRSSR